MPIIIVSNNISSQ